MYQKHAADPGLRPGTWKALEGHGGRGQGGDAREAKLSRQHTLPFVSASLFLGWRGREEKGEEREERGKGGCTAMESSA